MAGLRPRGDQLRLFAAGLGIVGCILILVFVSIKYNIPMPSRDDLEIFVVVVLVSSYVAYMGPQEKVEEIVMGKIAVAVQRNVDEVQSEQRTEEMQEVL